MGLACEHLSLYNLSDYVRISEFGYLRGMKVAEAMKRWPDHDSALAHLEAVRWQGSPECPYCNSRDVSPHAGGDRRAPRWQCKSCHSAFSATVGTVFHRSHLPLHNWMVAIVIAIGDARISTAAQISNVLGIPYKTAWSLLRRIRAAAEDPAQGILFQRLMLK